MKTYNKKIAVTLLLSMFVTGSSDAKVRAVMTRRDLERTLAKESMAVVLFYEDQKGVRNQNKDIHRMYDDISSYRPYDDADIAFLKINVGRKDSADLVALYEVKTIPAFVFFYKGRCLTVMDSFVPRADVESAIEQYYGEEIKRRVAQKEARRKQIVKEESESWKPYFYPRDMFVRDYDPSERNME